MAQVEFGVFDWIDARGIPLGQLYEERLQLVEAAEAAGFSCYQLAEHHGTPLGMAPSPAVFLSAVAQRTKRIRFGPLVFLLPLYSPLRLIGEICMLDQMSGGRLELGIGRGVSPYESGHHGIDPAGSRPMFEEALAVLIAGLTGERLTHKGQYYRYDDVPMELRPLQRPYPPLWYPTSNFESVAWVAARGLHLMGLGSVEAFRPFVQRYREVHAQHAADPGRLNPHVARPRIGINRRIVVAETDAEAEAIARAVHPRFAASFNKLWIEHGDTSLVQRMNIDQVLRAETMLWGSPERVRAQVGRLLEIGVDYVSCAFAWGDLSLEQSLRSLRLFAEQVMPAFRPAAPGAAGGGL